MARVLGEKGVFIGSVKLNMGHLEGAAGGTSVMKTGFALKKQVMLPNINFITPNPKIPFKEGRLKVPTEAIPWPTYRLQRASVNSFGFGGANAHAILNSATQFGINRSPINDSSSYKLLIFFGQSSRFVEPTC